MEDKIQLEIIKCELDIANRRIKTLQKIIKIKDEIIESLSEKQGAVLSNGGPPVLKITAIKNKTNPYAKGVEENV